MKFNLFFKQEFKTAEEKMKENAKELNRFANKQFKKLAEKNLAIPVEVITL